VAFLERLECGSGRLDQCPPAVEILTDSSLTRRTLLGPARTHLSIRVATIYAVIKRPTAGEIGCAIERPTPNQQVGKSPCIRGHFFPLPTGLVNLRKDEHIVSLVIAGPYITFLSMSN